MENPGENAKSRGVYCRFWKKKLKTVRVHMYSGRTCLLQSIFGTFSLILWHYFEKWWDTNFPGSR